MSRKQKTRNKGGRPSKYNKKVVREICDRLAKGESLRAVCRDEHMPHRDTVNLWTHEKEKFSVQYARAREVGWYEMADEILEIADDSTNDYMTVKLGGEDGVEVRKLDPENIQRSRARIDARKWLLSKMMPKQFGDKITHSGDENAPLVPDVVKIEFVKAEPPEDDDD